MGLNTRLQRLSAAFVALAVLGSGCGKGGDGGRGGGSTTEPSPITRAAFPIGYGAVSSWQRTDPSFAAALFARNGLTLTEIEWLPEEGRSFPAEGRAWVAAMRAKRITTFINIVNWNDSQANSADDAQFQEWLNEVKVVGESLVWVQGVSESNGDGKARRWQQMTVDQWPGIAVGNASHNSAVGGEDRLSYHACTVPALLALLSPARLVVTDCTPVLGSNLSEADVRALTRAALDRAAPFIIYDTFGVPINARVIEWMSTEIAR